MSQPPQHPQGGPNQNWQGQPQQGGYPQQGFGPQGGYPQQGYQQQPPKKKGGCMKVGLIILGVLIVLGIIIAAVSGGNDDSSTVSSGEGSSQDSRSGAGGDSGEKAGGGVAFMGKTDKDTGANAGETITQKKIAITTTPLQAKQSQFMPPQLCTTITIKNDGDKQHAFNMFDWKMQDPNGAAKNGMPPFDNSGSAFNSGEIAPGGQTTGDLCFDGDPASSPGEYVVLYQGNVFLSDRLAWVNRL